jgi:biofilm PGA synthesis lipoprotein PgaB
VDFGGEEITRNKILSWNELKEMQNSGLVEIASHSYHLHRGVNANPQGNSEPAAITRIYDSNTKTYERCKLSSTCLSRFKEK